MSGVLTAYNSGTGAATLEVDTIGGAGTFAAWNCGLAAGRPYAFASQAEAQGGTDNSKVMTPLRTAQALRGGQTPVSITAATNLTVTSAAFQVANMPARGIAVTLPDAMTLQTGYAFKIVNSGIYDLPIKDGAGAVKAFVRPGKTVTATLSAIATPAGAWIFEDAGIYGCTVDTTLQVTGGGANGNLVRVIALDASRDLVVFAMISPYSLRCVVHDRVSNTFGAPATIQTGTSVFMVVPVNASTVLAVYGQDDTMSAVTLSISGTAVTVNTPTAVSGFLSSIDQMFDAFLVGGVHVFRIWSSYQNSEYVFAVNPNGVSPIIGAPLQIPSAGTNAFDAANCFCSFSLTATSFVVFSAYNAGSAIYCRLVSVSGTSLVITSNEIFSQDSGSTAYKVELLSTGRFLLMFTQSGVAYAQLLTVSGTTTSMSTRLTLGSMASAAGVGFNGAASGVLMGLSGGRALCSWIDTTAGVSNWLILTDTSGTLSASTLVTRGADFQASASVIKIGVTGNLAYLARSTTSNFAEFYAVDCSGAVPGLINVQRLSTGLNPHFGLSSYTPQNKFRSAYINTNAMQGGAGLFGLMGSNSSSGSSVLSVWAFNPYPRPVPVDSTDGFVNGYHIIPGSQLNEIWAGTMTARVVSLRRVDSIV